MFYAFELVNKQSKNQKYSSKCTKYDFLPIFPDNIGGEGGGGMMKRVIFSYPKLEVQVFLIIGFVVLLIVL